LFKNKINQIGACDRSNSKLIKSVSETKRYYILTSISGGLAGLTEATLNPFERVQAVLQQSKFHDSYKHTFHVFQEITREHGFKELYRGMSAICLRNSFSNAVFFSLRSPIKSLFPEAKSKVENSVYDFINGGLLGACLSTLNFPLNVIKSNMQAKIGGKFTGIYHTFKLVYEARDRRILLMFKGVGSNFTRALLGWGITNSVYELILINLKS
jgi:hypothetical protein